MKHTIDIASDEPLTKEEIKEVQEIAKTNEGMGELLSGTGLSITQLIKVKKGEHVGFASRVKIRSFLSRR